MAPIIGLTLSVSDNSGRSSVIDFAQRAEALGYDSLWCGESWGRDLVTTLTHVACHTSRIKLATGIINVFSRTPSLVAQTLASLDEISAGRAILGLGSSGAKVVRDWHGLSFDRPLQRTREFIEIVNLALSGQRVDYEGQFYRLHDFALRLNPPRNHIPVYVASLGPKNVELTGELADGWSPVFFSPDHLDTFNEQLAVGRRKASRSVDAVEMAPWMICCVSDDGSLAKALVRRHIAYYVGGMGRYYRDVMVRYGFQEEVADIEELWKVQRDREAAADAVTDPMVAAVSITGTGAQCRQRMQEIQAMGITVPVVMVPLGSPKAIVNETIQQLAPASFS